MEFKGDVRDVKFVVFEMLKVEELAKHPRYGEATHELLEMIIDEGYTFAKEVLSPTFETGDRAGCQFEGGKVSVHADIAAALSQWGQSGWGGVTEDPKWGGQGLPLVMSSVLNEFFTGSNCALSLVPMLTVGAAHLMERFAPSWINEVCLERMYSLQWCGAMCLTEPQAGSDVGASKTKAVKLADGTYKIIGTKNFITGGDHDMADNIIHMVLARIEGAPAGTRGLSLFVVPKHRFSPDGKITEFNDVAAVGIEHKMGIHGTPTCTMAYGENEKCIGYLMGEENGGMSLMFHLMNEARIWVGMQGLALGSSAYHQALAYARERLQGSDVANFKDPNAAKAPIIKHPDVRRMLMTMKAWTEAMRGLFLHVAWMEDMVRVSDKQEEKDYYQGLVDLLTPVCKAFGSDTGFDVTSLGVQVLGGYGYCKEYPLEQLLRDARIAAIYEGTNGIQAMDLFARKVPWKGGALFKAYMGEIGKFVAENKGKSECIEDLFTGLAEAQNVLVQTTVRLGALAKEDLALGLLQATPYCKLFGHVACGYELARQAVVAHEKLNKMYADKGITTREERRKLYETSAEAHFYRSKVFTARFFFSALLPNAYGIAKSLESKDRSALDILFGLGSDN
jgi:alkylation response protein AidB-like acyl-CoA dehydrogenase